MTWVDTSKLKRTIMRYNDEVRTVQSFFESIRLGRIDPFLFRNSWTTSIFFDLSEIIKSTSVILPPHPSSTALRYSSFDCIVTLFSLARDQWHVKMPTIAGHHHRIVPASLCRVWLVHQSWLACIALTTWARRTIHYAQHQPLRRTNSSLRKVLVRNYI